MTPSGKALGVAPGRHTAGTQQMLVRVIIVSGLSPPLSWFLLLISMKGISSHSEVLSANRWLLPFPFSTSKRSSAPLYSAFEMFIKPLLFLPLYCHCAGLAHKGYCNGSLNLFPLVLFFLSKKKKERENQQLRLS